jgi:hypothetical protein
MKYPADQPANFPYLMIMAYPRELVNRKKNYSVPLQPY